MAAFLADTCVGTDVNLSVGTCVTEGTIRVQKGPFTESFIPWKVVLKAFSPWIAFHNTEHHSPTTSVGQWCSVLCQARGEGKSEKKEGR